MKQPNQIMHIVSPVMKWKGRGSNEIGTCIYKQLESLPTNAKRPSLFSDSCGGQNRNQNVIMMFLDAIMNLRLDEITINYLEPGHTYMEADSMHSAIEKEKNGYIQDSGL